MTSESEAWHDELVLITDLASVNTQIRGYILRALDADAGRTDPTSPADENALGARLVKVGTDLQSRAEHRTAINGSAGVVVIDTSSTETDTDSGEL